ncbi:MAG TPA: HEAT repeat domain-containing protein [Candidatus Limnocylindria bacterium]|nr:HEAT repeat domain-containing protein [Candidatus Limnocylindria bacterium]
MAVFVAGIHFDVGERTIHCSWQPATVEENLFFRSCWDGPTGEFTSGNFYGVKVSKWVLRLDVIQDPLGAAQRKLPATIEGLIAATKSDNHWRRVCALQRLAELGEAAMPAIPALLKQLSWDDQDAHDALLAISKAAPDSAVPLLTGGMTSASVSTRRHVAEILGEIGGPANAAVPVLTKGLHDSDPKVIIQCAFALSKIDGAAHDVMPVLKRFLANPDGELRASSMVVLNEFGADADAATPEVLHLLDDSNLNVRAMAARTLATVRRASGRTASGIPNATLIRLESLAGGDDVTAPWAIDALSTMGTNGAKVLADIYETAEHPRRREVADALIRLGPQAAAALPILLADLAGTNDGRAHLSARVIGHLGSAAKNALPQLTVLLEHDSGLIRVQAARAIWQLDRRTNVVLPLLLRELNGSSSNVRRFAAEGLGDMGSVAAEAAPMLKALESDARSDVRRAAADALGKIGVVPGDELPR